MTTIDSKIENISHLVFLQYWLLFITNCLCKGAKVQNNIKHKLQLCMKLFTKSEQGHQLLRSTGLPYDDPSLSENVTKITCGNDKQYLETNYHWTKE